MPVAEIRRLVREEGNINRAKEILAFEATALAHGEAAAREAYLAAGSKFGFADPERKIQTTSRIGAIDPAAAPAVELPTVELDKALFDGDGLWIARLLVDTGMCKSTSDARRLVQGGAVAIDDVKISDPSFAVRRDGLSGAAFTLKAGKKNFKRIVLK